MSRGELPVKISRLVDKPRDDCRSSRESMQASVLDLWTMHDRDVSKVELARASN